MSIKYRQYFPIFEQNKNLVFLDSAASSLKLNTMIDSTLNYYKNSGVNIHRGLYDLSENSTKEYEKTRQLVASFINSKTEEIIFTKSSTESLNMVCDLICPTLEEGDEIITSQLEHHSSVLPWVFQAKTRGLVIKYVELVDNRITLQNLEKLITSKTKVIALTHVANTLGYLTPIKEIASLAKKHHIITSFDCAQGITFNKIDVKEIGCDFLSFSAHKLYGPNGVGVLFGRSELLNKYNPVYFGGDMVDEVHLEEVILKEIPYKYEPGTPNIAGVIAFGECIKFINQITISKIVEEENSLHQYLLKKMNDLPFIEIYNPTSEASIVLFNVKGVHPHDVSTILNNYHVCVRAGHHCAMLVSDKLNVISTLRASINIYNTKEDCDTLITALLEVKKVFLG